MALALVSVFSKSMTVEEVGFGSNSVVSCMSALLQLEIRERSSLERYGMSGTCQSRAEAARRSYYLALNS